VNREFACNVLLGLKPRSFLKPCRRPTPGGVDPRTTRLGYRKPQYCEVLCGIVVHITAPATAEVGAGKAFVVTVPEMQTGMAHLGGIGWRTQHQQDRSQGGFVLHKLPQLVERPAIASAAFHPRAWLGIGPRTHARQIFQDQHGLVLSSLLDKGLTDDVVGVPLKPSLTPR